MSILKVDVTIVPLFFLIRYSLIHEINICLEYFLEKNPKNPLQKATIVR